MKSPTKQPSAAGLTIAIVIIITWFFHLKWSLMISKPLSFWIIFPILIQTHLFTGLFITAHDGMHHLIHPNETVNHIVGRVSAFLFMGNSYSILYPKHQLHHQYVATERDPDFSTGNFFIWYIKFLKEYITWKQFMIVAIVFNILKIQFSTVHLLLFWVLPSIVSTIQLFYFGTYLPHRPPHQMGNKHFAKSFPKNHVLAFFSCYFFGYHYEHHDQPWVPWWKLWTIR